VSSRAKDKFKRDREDESDPAVQPEMKLHERNYVEGCTALSVVKGHVTARTDTRGRGRGFCVHGGYRSHGFVDSARNM
jgi:hypothetical protein